MKNYHKNPRQIKDKQFADLRTWLLELGDLSGIVHDLNTDEVISGNQRMRAIDIARCEIVLTEGPHDPDAQGTVAHGYVLWQGAKYNYRQVRWTAEQCEKANIVANKAGGTWDFDVLANEWEKDDLLEWGFELEELGMLPDDETPEDPGAQIDKAEELREKWGVETGQLWQLGEHRLVCGDCTDAAVVARVMQREKAGACVTDPPYGINVVENSPRLKELGYSQFANDENTNTAEAAFSVWAQHGAQIWWGANYYSTVLPVSRCWLVWDKDHHGMDYADAEIAWCNVDKPVRVFRHAWSGADRDSEKGEKRSHPNQKPVALFEWCITQFCGDAVIITDPFLGAGGSLIACERLGRKCRAVELSPGYAAVSIQRWVDMTGGTPELVAPSSDLQ